VSLGFTAIQAGEMSLWQFMAQVDGYIDANTPEDKKIERLSEAEMDVLAKWVDD